MIQMREQDKVRCQTRHNSVNMVANGCEEDEGVVVNMERVSNSNKA